MIGLCCILWPWFYTYIIISNLGCLQQICEAVFALVLTPGLPQPGLASNFQGKRVTQEEAEVHGVKLVRHEELDIQYGGEVTSQETEYRWVNLSYKSWL